MSEALISSDPLPIHFLTIVLDGEPFIRYHIDVFKSLPFEWHWHIVEGVADQVNDSSWTQKTGGRVPARYTTARSLDGTSEYLDKIAAEFRGRVTLYRKPPGVRWEGKREMFNVPTATISQPCLLWAIDVDEFWTAEQIVAGRRLFMDHAEKTAAFYWCWFFVGSELVTCTRLTYGNRRTEWLRTWRFKPGMVWNSQAPPVLLELIRPGTAQVVAEVNPFSHNEMEAVGLVFQHLAYATEAQVRFKEEYYGYAGAVAGWRALQANAEFPVPLKKFFPWVTDETLVDRAEYFLDRLLFAGG